MKRRLAACLLFLAAHTSAEGSSTLIDDLLSPEDKVRLETYDEVRTDAIAAARRDGDPDAVTVLDAILAGTPKSLVGESLVGDYRCRIAKLDGVLPLIVYGWFRCRIDEDALGYHLVKVTGSQRTSLRFIDEGERRLIAYGAEHYGDEIPMSYGAIEDRNQVGYMVKAEGGRYRVEFPRPLRESNFDILELERR